MPDQSLLASPFSCLFGRGLAAVDHTEMGVEPFFESVEFGCVPDKTGGQVFDGFQGNELVVSPEVDKGSLHFLAIEMRIELHVSDISHGIKIGSS